MPIILVTAKADSKDVVVGSRPAPTVSTKPVDQTALLARVRSVLRTKELHDQVRAQAADLASWNRTLEQRVEQQLSEIERVSRLKRFLSPQVAELILSSGDDSVLQSHRRAITVVFCDLRGFTAFSETTEPEEVMAVLREYHAVLGTLIYKHQGTLERFAGDAIMVLFNDPLPLPGPQPAGGPDGDGDARPGGRACPQVAQARVRPRFRSWHRARLRHALGASASRGGSTTARSARWSILRPGYARTPRTGRS